MRVVVVGLLTGIFAQGIGEKPYNRGMERIFPANVKAIGPYSPAVRIGPWVFLSGQIALKSDGEIEKSSIEKEVEQVLYNIRMILESVGAKPENIVKVTIFLTDMAFFPQVNAVYEKFFQQGKYPARETVAVAALPKGARIEISAIAYIE
ncbi:MAG: RidA family protein [Bacteroidia bacterium]|nr:RidA family protein [Bacteroidia bacterium]MDW8134264.1 RidA family protein [Bacteroidia bacterium]